jgi:DNA-binding NtrC family response regulator
MFSYYQKWGYETVAGKILIVDQNPNYREILRALLEKSGYMVTALEDGHQVGSLFNDITFDIIFLDSETGGVRDKVLFAEIRKECPHSFIILITSKRGNGLIKEAMDAGAYGCIDKPFNPDEVLTMVHQLSPTRKSSNIESQKKRER